MVNRRIPAKSPLFFLVLLTACAPAESPRARVTMREGTTVRTSCDDTSPDLADEVLPAKPYGHVIDRVCIYGGSDAEPPLVTFHVGDKLGPEAVRATLDALLASPVVDDAAIGAELRGDGAVVHVVVKERPIVESFEMTGGTLPAKPAVVAGDRLDQHRLNGVARRLQRDYVEQGYGNANVEPIVAPGSDGKVRVTLKVNEGRPWVVGSMAFSGNARVASGDLQSATQIANGSRFQPDLVERAGLYIGDLYMNRGFMYVKVSPATIDARDASVALSWSIEEGDVFTIGAIKFTGLAAGNAKELIAGSKLRPKAIFDRSLIVSEVQRIRDVFAARGKLVEVTPNTSFDLKKKTGDLDFNVQQEEPKSP